MDMIRIVCPAVSNVNFRETISPTCKVKVDWLTLLRMCSVIGQICATHPRAATHFSDRETTRLDKDGSVGT